MEFYSLVQWLHEGQTASDLDSRVGLWQQHQDNYCTISCVFIFHLSFSALLMSVCVTDEEQHLHLIRTTEKERSLGSRIIRDKTLLTILHKTHRAVKWGCVSSIRLTFSISPVVIESFSTDYFSPAVIQTQDAGRGHMEFIFALGFL